MAQVFQLFRHEDDPGSRATALGVAIGHDAISLAPIELVEAPVVDACRAEGTWSAGWLDHAVVLVHRPSPLDLWSLACASFGIAATAATDWGCIDRNIARHFSSRPVCSDEAVHEGSAPRLALWGQLLGDSKSELWCRRRHWVETWPPVMAAVDGDGDQLSERGLGG